MTLGIFLVLVLANPLAVQSPSIPSELSMVQENSLMPISVPYIYAKLGTLGDLYWEDEEYSVSRLKELVGEKSVIDCLIRYESSWNPEAVGDFGQAIGLLQFHRPTFERYAKKYNLELDIKNPNHQILLANLMLNDNFNNVYQWSVASRCLSQIGK